MSTSTESATDGTGPLVVETQVVPATPIPVVDPAPGNIRRVLLVWDAPNLDMGLGAILGGRPTAAHRPRFDALGRWLLAQTSELSALSVGSKQRVEPEATVFTNIAPGSADVVRPWVEALRNVGYAVFAKPKIDEDSDVDADMLSHIQLRSRGAGLAGLMVASADGQAFREPLEALASTGVPVQVLGFREHASWAVASESLQFIDLEDIPGVFREPLPRVSLDSLPAEGSWLQPFRPLSALLSTRPEVEASEHRSSGITAFPQASRGHAAKSGTSRQPSDSTGAI